jgi:hypothetical protein
MPQVHQAAPGMLVCSGPMAGFEDGADSCHTAEGWAAACSSCRQVCGSDKGWRVRVHNAAGQAMVPPGGPMCVAGLCRGNARVCRDESGA